MGPDANSRLARVVADVPLHLLAQLLGEAFAVGILRRSAHYLV